MPPAGKVAVLRGCSCEAGDQLAPYVARLHDPIDDTPVCTATDSSPGGGSHLITIHYCVKSDTNRIGYERTCPEACPSYNPMTGQFCPDVRECQFNYVMWWTTKNLGDGNVFSPHSGLVMSYSPLVH